MSIIMDKIRIMNIGEGDSISISCRNGKTYDGCIVRALPAANTGSSILVELINQALGKCFMNIQLAEIKIIRKQ